MSTHENKGDGTVWAVPNHHPDQIFGERRHDRRYDVGLDLKWKLIRRRKVLCEGSGRTVDLSSGGILIEVDRPLPVGLNLELSINWPVMLQNAAPLQLVVAGRIVRSQGRRSAIRMMQHEFRTLLASGQQGVTIPGIRRPRGFVSSPPESGGYSQADPEAPRANLLSM